MIAIIAQTYIGEAKLPAVTHRFLAPTYKEARNLFRLHREHDKLLRYTTGKSGSGAERGGDFRGVPARTVFKVQRVEWSESRKAESKDG
jgi:hypothetical protein